MIGSVCPGPEVFGQECPNQPYQAEISILDQNGQLVVKFQSDTKGNFLTELPPGTYTVHPESPNIRPRAQDQIVTIIDGQFTEVLIVYDSEEIKFSLNSSILESNNEVPV